jgi:xanthine dehydrogenase YagS FAD-binding subunit
MRTFLYQRAREPNEAAQLAAAANPASARSRNKVEYLAGGTTLTDLMKLDVAQPDVIIDINPLTETGHGRIELSQRGLRLGALVRMAEAADHPGVKSQYPVVAQSLFSGGQPAAAQHGKPRWQCLAAHALHLLPRRFLF